MKEAAEEAAGAGPMVSVVIPVYRVERLVARCLDSVLVQTWTHLEVIVVNDATPDRSMEVVARYAARDSRIKVIDNDRNRGLMMARRIGYERASGEYVAFLDSDDFLPPRALETMVRAAEANGADLVCGQRDRVREDGTHDSRTRYRFDRPPAVEETYRAMLRMSFPDTAWGKLYSRRLFDPPLEAFENQTEGEDVILSFLLAPRVRRVVFIGDVVYHYFENDASSTNRKTLAGTEERIRAVKFVEGLASQFPSLRSDFIAWAAIVLHLHYRHGARDKAAVRRLLVGHGMERYVRAGWLVRNLSAADFRYLLKRCLCISLIRWCPRFALDALRRLLRR